MLAHIAANAGFRRYFANTAWLFSEQVLRLFVGVLVGIWVARYLGPTQFGIFSYAIAFVAIFGSLAKLGLDAVVVRELVQTPRRAELYLGTAFWLKLVAALVTLAVVAAATTFTSNSNTTNLYILIIASALVFQAFEVVDFYFQSLVLSKYVSVCRLVQLLISAAVKVYLVLVGASLFWFVAVVLLDQLTLAVSLSFAYVSRTRPNFLRHFDLRVSRKLLADGWPLILSGLLVMIYMRIDQVMIQEMLGEREVGIYSASVRLTEALYFVPAIVVKSVFPAIVTAKQVDEHLYHTRLLRLYSFLGWGAIFIALPMSLLSEKIVTFVYGVEYLDAAPVVAVQVWAGVFAFIGVASGKWFISENLQKLQAVNVGVGAASNVVLNLVLIPTFGIEGAALATLVSYMIAAYWMNVVFKRTRSNFIRMTTSLVLPWRALVRP